MGSLFCRFVAKITYMVKSELTLNSLTFFLVFLHISQLVFASIFSSMPLLASILLSKLQIGEKQRPSPA